MPASYAYLGPEGTFTEVALRTLPEAATRELVPYVSVQSALDAVRAGEAEAAFVPIENSVEGGITTTLDELVAGTPLMIYREVLLSITFALLVRPGTKLSDIKTVTAVCDDNNDLVLGGGFEQTPTDEEHFLVESYLNTTPTPDEWTVRFDANSNDDVTIRAQVICLTI